MNIQLTDEQAAVVDLTADGDHLIVEALAGTGKTSTVEAICKHHPTNTLYIAFNRAVVDEASTRMGRRTRSATIHELAFKAIGDPWTRRAMTGRRVKSTTIARRMGLDDIWLSGPWGNKQIGAGFVGGLITRSLQRFARTADPRPGPHHVPIPRAARHDPDLLLLYREIRDLITPKLSKAWEQTVAIDGDLPIDGNTIIKMWQLSNPVLPWDRIIIDEAQDLNDAARAVVQAQMGRAQVVAVGDTFQQINAWNGAVNALSKFPIDRRLWLTNCWRFGPEIADHANQVLDELGSEHKLIGRGPTGTVGSLDPGEWDVRLSRTNAEAVAIALEALDEGRRPHIIGGATDVVRFCEGALALQEGRQPEHPELACFNSWGEVLAYVATDELGGDLAPMANLITKFGAQTVVDTMGKQPDEDRADLILSTTHKIKGRQWHRVQVAGDFEVLPGSPLNDVEELRLLYVATTRAQSALDVDEPPFFPTYNREEALTRDGTPERPRAAEAELDADDAQPGDAGDGSPTDD